jgi:hypothetical protein
MAVVGIQNVQVVLQLHRYSTLVRVQIAVSQYSAILLVDRVIADRCVPGIAFASTLINQLIYQPFVLQYIQ